ncbi:MAG: FeoB-associated Cys-rich membrane protein [Prevotella sp.]|nr:FeoB-associated Cys-rich membrane protein [Prevotella sp.]
MNHQLILVCAVLTLAVAYAVYRIYQSFLHANDPCRGCDGCALKDMKRRARKQKTPCEIQKRKEDSRRETMNERK